MKNVIQLILLLNGLWSYSQTFVVADSLTQEPLAFATVVLDEKKMLYSNEKGVFLLESKYKSVSVSFMGYEDFASEIRNLNDTIFLKPKTFLLDKVSITNNKNIFHKIGFLKHTMKKCITNLPLSPKREQLIVIIPTNDDIIDSYLEKIEFPLYKIKHYNKTDKLYKNAPAVLRINIYTVKDDLPDQKIFSSEPIKFIMSNKELIQLDISGEMIQLPQEGLCFGIEMIGRVNQDGEFVEENSYARPLLTNQSSKDYKAITYLTNSILKQTQTYHPINNINEFPSCKPQDYNLAIGLTLRK
jgi:hypothetical protein